MFFEKCFRGRKSPLIAVLAVMTVAVGVLLIAPTKAEANLICSLTDVTPSTDCFGALDGNDSAATLNAIPAFGADDWALFQKFDVDDDENEVGEHPDLVLGFTTLKSGTWEIDLSGFLEGNIFAIVVKGADDFAGYLLDLGSACDGLGLCAGTWSTAALLTPNDDNANQPDLSHLSLYEASGGGDLEVPEPGTMALFGLGVAGLAFVRRRRRKS